ncbi:MAG: hypothetical protein CME67_03455 [Halobacteriovoraceae bacterium]|nr:hypothetical protein [Halobacteriovoraceae bacterium]
MEHYQRINTVCLFALTFMACAFVLAITKTVMIPFTLSIFLYLILTPVMKWLQIRFRLKRWMALSITLFIFTASIICLTWLVSGSIDSFIQGIDQYKDRLDALTSSIELKLKDLGFDLSTFSPGESAQITPLLPTLKKLTTGVLGVLSNSILVIIFTLFLITGESIHGSSNETVIKVKNSIAKYVFTKLVISAATGGLSYIVFLIFEVELASMFAILTILLNFIPNIGSIIAVFMPLPVILLQYTLGWQFFAILILLTLFQTIIGNILEPKVMGKSMGLHPVAILLSLTFWGFIWGVPGMFLSVPIMAAMKIIFESYEFTSPIAAVMEGKLD